MTEPIVETGDIAFFHDNMHYIYVILDNEINRENTQRMVRITSGPTYKLQSLSPFDGYMNAVTPIIQYNDEESNQQ